MKRKKDGRTNENIDNYATVRGKKRSAFTLIAAAMAFTLALSVFLLSACKDKGTDWSKYFNDFSSSEVTKATCTLNLSQKTYVSSFNPTEEVFITARNYTLSDGSQKTIYGLASAYEEYCVPYYTAVLQIYGDYALVTRPGGEEEYQTSNYIDLIKYRNTGSGKPYSLMSGLSIVHSDSYTQMSIVGDYVAVSGELENISSAPDCAVFYDYVSGNELLEAFRIRAAYDKTAQCAYAYKICDGYLAAYSTDRAFFYNLSDPPTAGYLEPARGGEYVPFADLTSESLASFQRELDVYYIGNGWFVRSAMIYSNAPYQGFLFKIQGESELLSRYVRPKTDFFNVRTGKSSSFDFLYSVAGVANEYNYSYYEQQSYMLGSLHSYDEETDSYDFNLPFANPAAMIKKGYSIVYYYYRPYLEEASEDDVLYAAYKGETTYCILDENLNKIQPENALMPTMYIDGVGVQTSDPYYTEAPGTAYAYDKYMNETVLATFSQGKATYIPYYANAAACIVRGTLVTESGESGRFYGAVTPNGERITDFIYDELSVFSGGYAIGSVTTDEKKTYYRIDDKGAREEITDVLLVYQGTYSYRDGDKVGLKNYKGEVLIPAEEGAITVADKAMTADGKAMKSFVAVTKNDVARIYALS